MISEILKQNSRLFSKVFKYISILKIFFSLAENAFTPLKIPSQLSKVERKLISITSLNFLAKHLTYKENREKVTFKFCIKQ
jgi:hypothetical protein